MKKKNPNKKVETPIYRSLTIAPVVRRINDIGSWKSALRSADIGIRWPLYDLYEDVLIDGTVTDAIGSASKPSPTATSTSPPRTAASWRQWRNSSTA